MRLEQTLAVIIALLFASDRAHGQANTLLDPALGPQPATGFKISVPPATITASFTFSPSGGSWPLTVQFVDTTQGGPASWAWDFGDGGTATSQNPIHTFQAPSNTFTIQLTATGPGGSSTVSHTLTTTNPVTFTLLSAPANTVQWNIADSDGGAFKGFAMRPAFPGVCKLFTYDLVGHTNYMDLTNTDNNSGQGESQILFMPTNRLLIFNNFSIPSSNSAVQEYILYTNGFGNPTQAVFDTQITVGDSHTAYGCMAKLSGGGVGLCAYPINDQHGLFSIWYRRVNGVWTNSLQMISTNVCPSISALYMACAEHPDGNAWWLFVQPDSSGKIWGYKFQPDSFGLNYIGTNLVANNNTTNGIGMGFLRPYGENEVPHAITDWTNGHRIVLFYTSDAWFQYPVNYPGYYGDARFAVAAVDNAGNATLICSPTNLSPRLAEVSGSIPASSPNTVTPAWQLSNTNTFTAGQYALYQQDLINGVEQPTNFVAFETQFSLWLNHYYRRDVVYRDPASIWHLIIRP